MRSRLSSFTIPALLLCGCDTLSQDIGDIASAFKPTSPSEAARNMLDPYDADHRRQGTVLIAQAPFGGIPIYLAAYRDMVLNERDPVVKATAIRALARHGTPDDALRIMPFLTHENFQVRWEAAKGLQRLHNEQAVPELLKVLRNDTEHSDVRVAAATALGQYPQDRVVQGLIAALDARELAVNIAAEESLQTLTGQSFGYEPARWLVWYNQAAAAGTAFQGKREYLFPTYSRDETFLEKLAFWSKREFERPAQPAGLRPEAERTTYGDEGETPGG